MKKIIIIIIILSLIITGSYYYYNKIYLPSLKPTIEVEENSATISEYYIYGQYLNIVGEIKKINAKFKNIDLIFWNTKTGKSTKYEINYKKNVNNVKFNLSDEINDGLYLDDIKKGNYQIFLRFNYEEDDKKTYKYYPLKNTTDYKTANYYTTTKNNNKIIISSNNTTMTIKIKENTEETYDVVLDPSAGGIDKGVTANGYNEAKITLEIATKIKEKLEQNNIKVKLTRTEDSLSDNEYFDEYNAGGRAVIPQEVHSKYLFSFQVSKSNNPTTSGISIYTAANINYDFSTKLVENIKTNLKTSNLTSHRVDYGIYTHNFNESEIAENMAYYDKKGYKHYNVTTKSNYLYMIRETGGIITGAYIDDSNPEKVGVNPYYQSNVGVETYIIDLGYITNKDDLTAMTTNNDIYAEAISNSIIDKLKKIKDE